MKVADLYALLSIKPSATSFTSAERLIGGIKAGLTAVAVLGGVAAVAMGKMIGDTASVADQYAKMSKQVGISVEGLQQLEFAAKISGTGLQALRTGLQRFARTADDAGQGLKTAKEPFERLGVASHDANGNLRPLETMLGDVAEAFSKMEDGPEKTALSMKAFGRAGAQLIPLLNEGRDGVDALKKEFTSLGGEISGEQAAAFEEYNDTILRIKTTLIGFRNQAVIALLPMLKKITKSTFEWLKANKEMLKLKLEKFMRSMLKATVTLFKAIGFLIDHGGKMLRVFVIYKALLIAMAAKTAILAAVSSAAGWTMFTAWLKATLPVVLMIALFVALALVIEDFIGFLTGKDSVIGAVFGDAIEQWLQDFAMFFREVRKGMNKLGTDFLESPAMRLMATVTGSSAAFDQVGKMHKRKLDILALQDAAEGVKSSFRSRQAAQDLAPSEFSASESAGVFAPGTTGGGVGPLSGAPVAGPTNNFVFNGVGTEEVRRVVGDVVRENDQANANAIGVETP